MSSDPGDKNGIMELKQQPVYKWSDDITKEFIRLRTEKDDLFTGRRNSSITGWNIIIEHLGIQAQVSPEQARKKWTNLCQKYKEIRASFASSDSSEVYSTWPYLEDLDRYFLTRNGLMADASSSADSGTTISFDPSALSTIKLTYDPATASLTYATTSPAQPTTVTLPRRPSVANTARVSPQLGAANRFRKRKLRNFRPFRTVSNTEENMLGLLQESVTCLRSIQESLRSQSEALVGLLTELTRQKTTARNSHD